MSETDKDMIHKNDDTEIEQDDVEIDMDNEIPVAKVVRLEECYVDNDGMEEGAGGEGAEGEGGNERSEEEREAEEVCAILDEMISKTSNHIEEASAEETSLEKSGTGDISVNVTKLPGQNVVNKPVLIVNYFNHLQLLITCTKHVQWTINQRLIVLHVQKHVQNQVVGCHKHKEPLTK